ncbi:formimidoylglutamate deiminase [Maribrevibacterium harenarium]|uniref:Formimidoylglutamate deiminase n=1 Tax=Maribrevibacterium harenarium TaxID=2589817 RepID=A0A501WVR3_9GAMM|nr:formimidoylglutamate deiminase [Maribrevibacterium harenarium]TPE53359.1 formimidoylglutamate deiminase [Maribrevibacterium harenarium]
MTRYFAPLAYLEQGWAHNVMLTVDQGTFIEITPNADVTTADTVLDGPVLPTVANLHSHAFQRLMAGMAEIATNPEDSFWSWRDVMYQTATELSPDELEIIASKLYIELLKGGFSHVAEFHYLHNQPDGTPYTNVTELGEAIFRAGQKIGMGVTLLPALYQYSGFGQQTPNSGQGRFIQSTQNYIEQFRAYERKVQGYPLHQMGLCFHSLRATDFDAIHTVIGELHQNQPIHIHIAEQTKEVDDCLTFSQKRPVQWLLDECKINKHWALIHATHLSPEEVQGIANAGATVGICTTTEANLGDGLFPAVAFEQAGGIWGVGSDSHVSTSLQEELRWFEYGQRLKERKRNCLYNHDPNSPSQQRIGDHLFNQALKGGSQACGVKLGLAVGCRADFMVWDEAEPFIHGSKPQDLLNRWLFGLNNNPIKDVFVAGECVINTGAHTNEHEVDLAFAEVVKKYFNP